MESRTYFKNLKITPRKLREVADMVRKNKPLEAVGVLSHSPKKAASILEQVLKSAITNAKQTLKVGEDMLEFKLLTIEEGQKLKRFRPGSRGMAKAFYRRFSHAKIIIGSRAPVSSVAKKEDKKVEEPKKETKKEPKKVEAKAESKSQVQKKS